MATRTRKRTPPQPRLQRLCTRCHADFARKSPYCPACYQQVNRLPALHEQLPPNHNALVADGLRARTSPGPVKANPGSIEKFAVLMARADRRLPLFDARDQSGAEQELVREEVSVFDDDYEEAV